jgi:phage tail-like protein
VPLLAITATAVPGQRRIVLGWDYPPGSGAAGVRVMRARGTHPLSPGDGTEVADGLGITNAVDDHLEDGVVYYYSLFPFSGSPRVYELDRRNRTAALASGPSGVADQMVALLPRIYRRYDTFLPSAPSNPADAQKGQLRRFLELPAQQLELFASVLASLGDAHDPWRVDGRLLPALAAWLGWRTDFTLELSAQRQEVRSAPAVYQTVGIIPTVEATVKRLVGSESRSKEMVHNVLCTNRPERLNLWSKTRTAGTWTSSTAPFSLDAAFDGRPALALAADGTLWLFYQVVEGDRSTIWTKQRAALAGATFTPSRPLVYRDGVDREPTAAAQGTRLWVIWSVFEPAQGRWSLEGRILDGNLESVATLPGDAAAERRLPALVTDATGGLWLFWMERSSALGPWTVKFNRHDGAAWDAPAAHTLVGTGGVEADLHAFFEATSGTLKLYWARREPIAAPTNALRWRLFSMAKPGLDPTVNDWSAVTAIADAPPGDHDDREPFAIAPPGGTEVLFSSNRGGSFAVWSLPPGGPPGVVSEPPFTERAPSAFVEGSDTLVVCRSNRGVAYRSAVYAATETVDLRYAGGTSASTRDTVKLGLRRSFGDFQTYTYDTGPGGSRRNGDWYARDSVGLYLTPPSTVASEVLATLRRLLQGLPAFMPATARAVLIPSIDQDTEAIISGLDTAGLP